MNSMSNAALILAGGNSTRMGRDKATLIVEGVPMIVRVAHALREGGCDPILIAVRDGYQRREIAGLLSHLSNVQFIIDNCVERGSKPALRSALMVCKEMGIEEIQLTPCDLPWLSADLIIRLRNGKDRRLVMPRSNHLQPMLALTEVQGLLDAFGTAPNDASLSDIMLRLPHRFISVEGIDERCLRNVNRPQDLPNQG